MVNYKQLLWSNYSGSDRAKLSAFLRDYRDDGSEALTAAMDYAEAEGIPFDRQLVEELMGMREADEWDESNWNSSSYDC